MTKVLISTEARRLLAGNQYIKKQKAREVRLLLQKIQNFGEEQFGIYVHSDVLLSGHDGYAAAGQSRINRVSGLPKNRRAVAAEQK